MAIESDKKPSSWFHVKNLGQTVESIQRDCLLPLRDPIFARSRGITGQKIWVCKAMLNT